MPNKLHVASDYHKDSQAQLLRTILGLGFYES